MLKTLMWRCSCDLSNPYCSTFIAVYAMISNMNCAQRNWSKKAIIA